MYWLTISFDKCQNKALATIASDIDTTCLLLHNKKQKIHPVLLTLASIDDFLAAIID